MRDRPADLVQLRQRSDGMMTSKGTYLAAALAGAGFLAMAAAANAQEPTSLGEFSDWTAYTYKSKNGPVCYVVSQPKKSQPDGVSRDPIFFLITHRPGEKVRNEVNTIIGYPFKKESSATVQIGSDSFELFTSGDGAWSESSARDSAIVTAMKSGQSMTVKGTSWRGTNTTDQYSLAGVSAAMQKIDSTCK